MTYEQFLAFAREHSGMQLTTVRGKEFEVRTYMDSIVFVPRSSGLGRSDGRRAGEHFVEQFNEQRSLRSADYQSTTYNASYYLALALEYESQQ